MIKSKYYDRDKKKIVIYSDTQNYIKKEYQDDLLIMDVIDKSDVPFFRYRETNKQIEVVKKPQEESHDQN